MKKLIGSLLLFFIFMSMPCYAVSSHVSMVKKFTSINRTGNIVIIDLNNKNIKPKVKRAYDKIAQAEPLKEMTERENNEVQKVIASINGTYFSSYDGFPIPYGTIIENGRVLHIGNYGSTIGFTKENKMILDNLEILIDGYINGDRRFYAWGINHPREEDDAITIYTPEYKEHILNGVGKKVVIENGLVKTILAGEEDLEIQPNQFVITFNKSVSYLVDRFKIGDKVEYKYNFNSPNLDKKDFNSINWTDVEWAIGAGPSLIIDGRITADGLTEGFFEDKINVNRAQRSFIGFTKDNKLIMGTVGSVNLKELANICLELNLVNAMCLDGGASSSLYYKGKYLTKPGRNLNNCLVFIEENINM